MVGWILGIEYWTFGRYSRVELKEREEYSCIYTVYTYLVSNMEQNLLRKPTITHSHNQCLNSKLCSLSKIQTYSH